MDGSELILNDRGALYHLDVKPGELASTIITVGDPERVRMIEKYFDKVHFKRGHREFLSLTGECNGHPLSVISTGIGTDNIDIALSEIDAVFNIDLKAKMPKEHVQQLTFIRLGTSGALHPEIELGDHILSKYAVGLDNLLHFYSDDNRTRLSELEKAVEKKISYPNYAYEADPELINHFSSMGKAGITFSCPGFYGPQGRRLRLQPKSSQFLSDLQTISYKGTPATNFEMETSGIYGLSKLMGHRAISISTILANRTRGEFSSDPSKLVNRMLANALEKIKDLK
jgi:uridine phosphorylase